MMYAITTGIRVEWLPLNPGQYRMDLFETVRLLQDKKLEAAGMTAARLDIDGLETNFDMSRESMILSIEAEVSRTLADASEDDLRHALHRSGKDADDDLRDAFAVELCRRRDLR